MGRWIAVVATLLVALLGAPRPSEAGLLDIIWEMSGPRMFGLSYACMVNASSLTLDQCRLGGPTKAPDATRSKAVPFIVLGGSLLGSTGHDSDTQGYDWGEIWMLAAEPGLAWRTHDDRKREIQVHHGFGISYEWLFGHDIRRFNKFAFTLTPVDVAYKRVAAGLKLRMYPNGFTDDEFKPGPLINKNRAFETTIGFTFSIVLFRQP